MKHEGWFPAELGVSLTPAQQEQLHTYVRFLRDIAVPRGMIAARDVPRLWERHVLDGLRGAEVLPAVARSVCDLGSGAGIPGIPVAIARPAASMVLTEPRRERAGFLELVAAELGLGNVQVHPRGARSLTTPVEACLARAFGDPVRTWSVAEPLLGPAGTLLYWAGRGVMAPVPNVTMRPFWAPYLADAGPIVMMTRQ